MSVVPQLFKLFMFTARQLHKKQTEKCNAITSIYRITVIITILQNGRNQLHTQIKATTVKMKLLINQAK